MSGYLLFGANTSGSQIQRMQGLNDLTVSGKSVLQCTSLVASEDVSCNTAVIGDLTVSGNLQVRGNIAFAGTLTVCNIFCPNDLFITAVSNIVMEAPTIRTDGQDVVLVGSNSIAAISGVALIELDSAAGTAKIESGSAGLVLTGTTGAAALGSTNLTVTTTATTSISSGENLISSDAATNISADGALDLSSSGVSGSIIRIKTEPGVNASGAISIATTAGFPTVNNDDIAIDSNNDLTLKSANDTRIIALAGDITTSSVDVSIDTSGTGGIKLGNSSTGNVNLELAAGDLRLGTSGDANVHLAFLGAIGAQNVAGLGGWAAATFALVGETDTTGVIVITNLPVTGGGVAITAGDGFRIEFSRDYESGLLQAWLSAPSVLLLTANPVLTARQASAGIALSGYYTDSDVSFIDFVFTKDVLEADIVAFTGTGYTNEMSFAYFIVDSIAA